jgi:hypothetical protein
MEDYRSNSNKSKERAQTEPVEEHRINAIVSSSKTKKKSGIRKFSDLIVQEDAANVRSYIVTDVLVPAVKKTISDIVKSGIDMFLYGESRRKIGGGYSSPVSYSSLYDGPKREQRNSFSRRSSFDFNDIIIPDRSDAESVLLAMEDLIERYGLVRVADVYDILDMSSSSNFTDNRYGWTNIPNDAIVRDYDGYRINLPSPSPIDR